MKTFYVNFGYDQQGRPTANVSIKKKTLAAEKERVTSQRNKSVARVVEDQVVIQLNEQDPAYAKTVWLTPLSNKEEVANKNWAIRLEAEMKRLRNR